MPTVSVLSRPVHDQPTRSWLTHPVVPLILFTGSLITGGILASEAVAWAAFGALAGYSLSGST